MTDTSANARLLCIGSIWNFGGGGEEDVGLGVGGGEGEDVEDVGGDDVGGEEVDLVGGVGDAVVVEVAFVGVAAVEDGAFDLDAEEVAVVVDGEVVGGAVSAGPGEDEAEFGGAELETEFGPLSASLGWWMYWPLLRFCMVIPWKNLS